MVVLHPNVTFALERNLRNSRKHIIWSIRAHCARGVTAPCLTPVMRPQGAQHATHSRLLPIHTFAACVTNRNRAEHNLKALNIARSTTLRHLAHRAPEGRIRLVLL